MDDQKKLCWFRAKFYPEDIPYPSLLQVQLKQAGCESVDFYEEHETMIFYITVFCDQKQILKHPFLKLFYEIETTIEPTFEFPHEYLSKLRDSSSA